MDLDLISRSLLPIYFILLAFFAFVWRSYIVWRETKINPYVLGKSDSAYDYLGFAFRVTIFLNLGAIIIYSFIPSLYRFLVPIEWLEIGLLRLVGLVMLFLALAWIVVAQKQMKNSWRIGIDNKNKTDLVNTGLYKLTRNPIFLGLRISGLGLFFVIPNAVTFATLLAGEMLMQVQVRLEEDFLLGLHGQIYIDFKEKVRRWV